MELHIAIRKAIKEHGYDIISDGRLINFLSDYQAFATNSTKKAMKEFVDLGFAKELLNLGKIKKNILSFLTGSYSIVKPQEAELNSAITKCHSDFSSKTTFNNEVESIIKAFVYGLGWIEDINKNYGSSNIQEPPTEQKEKSKKKADDWLVEAVKERRQQKFDEWNSEYVVFKINPSDAKVYVDDNKDKVYSANGFAELTYGEHTIEASAPMYQTERAVVKVEKGKKKTVSLSLKPNYGILDIKCNTERPKVYIDGKEVIIPIKLEPGNHRIEVKSPLYLDFISDIQVKSGNNIDLSVDLVPNYRELIVDYPESLPVTIYVESRNAVIKTSTNTPQRLAPGTYPVHCHIDGYKPFSTTVKVAMDDTNEPIHIKMPPLERNYGGLKVNVMPVGQKVIIDGKAVGTTPYKSMEIEAGEHTVLVKGDFTRKHKVTVREGKFTEIK